ncbi:hypothetical protein DFH09DRAFT_1101430 [Mycena vulgaris]|nr:hypothetical protein DFH09DRAFT_1101430 [Mycena vulgaris]
MLCLHPNCASLNLVLFRQDVADDEAEEGEDEEDDDAEEVLPENHLCKSSGSHISRGPRPSPVVTEVASLETSPKQLSHHDVPPAADTKGPRVLRSGNSTSGDAHNLNKTSGKASTAAPAKDEEEVDAHAKKSRTAVTEPSDNDMKDDEDTESKVKDQKTTHADSGKGPKLEPIKALILRNISDQVTKILEKRFSCSRRSKEEFPPDKHRIGSDHPYFYSFMAIQRSSDAPAATFYLHIMPKPVAHQTGRVQYQPFFKGAQLIDAVLIRTVKLEDRILPLIACLQCIFLNEPCIHLGYGAQCFNCNKLRICCGDRTTVPKHIQLNQEFAEEYVIASNVTESILGELVQSFNRASSTAKIYDEAIIELQFCLCHATDHVAKCVSHMGTEVFVQRFKDCSKEDNIVDFLNLLLASTSGFEGPSKTTHASLSSTLDIGLGWLCDPIKIDYFSELSQFRVLGVTQLSSSHHSIMHLTKALEIYAAFMLEDMIFEWLKFRTSPSFDATFGHRVVEYKLLYKHVPAVFAYIKDSFLRVMLEYYSTKLDKYHSLINLQDLEQEWLEHKYRLQAWLLISRHISHILNIP